MHHGLVLLLVVLLGLPPLGVAADEVAAGGEDGEDREVVRRGRQETRPEKLHRRGGDRLCHRCNPRYRSIYCPADN